MSHYRKFDSNPFPRSDIHVYQTIERRSVRPRKTTQETAGLEDRKHLRKATPANTLLPRTLKWVGTLPSDVQPAALLRHYVRIANLIAATWTDPKSCDAYMESLFADKRGNRRGFPPEVLSELVELRHYYNDILRKDASLWTIVGKHR